MDVPAGVARTEGEEEVVRLAPSVGDRRTRRTRAIDGGYVVAVEARQGDAQFREKEGRLMIVMMIIGMMLHIAILLIRSFC